MKIRFVGARPRDVALPQGRSFTVQPGGEYEVPDRIGAAMCEQRWFEPVDPPNDKKPPTDEQPTKTRKENAK